MRGQGAAGLPSPPALRRGPGAALPSLNHITRLYIQSITRLDVALDNCVQVVNFFLYLLVLHAGHKELADGQHHIEHLFSRDLIRRHKVEAFREPIVVKTNANRGSTPRGAV